MYSTAGDLCLWDKALSEKRLLGDRLTNLLFPASGQVNQDSGYGYGWAISRTRTKTGSTLVYSHIGAHVGYASCIQRCPDRKLVVIVLSNVDGSDASSLANAIFIALDRGGLRAI